MRRSLVLILSIVIVALPMAAPAGAVAPVNDAFADALALAEPLPALAAATTTDATTEIGEPVPSCIDNGDFGTSVWYKFTPSTDVSAALDTFGSDYDTVVALYTGATLNALTEIACNDEISFSPATEGRSRVAALLESGTTYHFQVSGFQGATGSLELKLVKRRTTPAVIRGDKWFLNAGFDGASEFSFIYGFGNDDPFGGNFLGLLFGQTGVSTPTVRKGNTWFLNDWFDGTAFVAFPYGRATDLPVAGDRNGDGSSDIGVVRGNVWHFDTDLDAVADETFAYGLPTDYPVVGDWNGDGTFTPGVLRGNKWFLNNGTDANADVVFSYGSATDFPVVGDWNGDGIWSAGVVRGNTWLLNNATDANADLVFAYGSVTDFPLVGDWDGAVED
ncbi:MAG: hypothetical protein ACRDJ1_04545 [Actinomycetota bacterium]